MGEERCSELKAFKFAHDDVRVVWAREMEGGKHVVACRNPVTFGMIMRNCMNYSVRRPFANVNRVDSSGSR